jgi:hypothetical protein
VGIKDLLGIAGAFLGTRERIILSFVGGLLVGLIILGWLIWPVQWKDAAPVDLQQGYRQIYLETVARISQDDPSVNVRRLLGDESWSTEKLTRDLNQAYNDVADGATRQLLSSLGSKLGITVDGTVEEPAGGGLGNILLVAFVVLILSFTVLALLRWRQRGAAPVAVGGDPEKVAAARTVWSETEAPMAQFVTSYGIGDDYYDQSFSIETTTGEFLGECGVGISEAIGVGDPKKVTAFEVWLFDKNDIRTVTKVLMTEHCYGDNALRAKLAPKGEAVLGQEGTIVSLETASLRVQTKVIEMEYGEGNLPPNSFVARLTIELAAWQLEGALAASDLPSAGDMGF